MRTARLFFALTCLLALALCAASPAAAVTLKRGVYDCMAYNYATGFSDYKGSIKIKPRNRYEHAFGREDAKLTDKTQGTYKRKGSLLIFKKGAMGGTKARVSRGSGEKREPIFDLLLKGEPSGITCYFVAKPFA